MEHDFVANNLIRSCHQWLTFSSKQRGARLILQLRLADITHACSLPGTMHTDEPCVTSSKTTQNYHDLTYSLVVSALLCFLGTMIWSPTRRRAELSFAILGIITLFLYFNFETSRRPTKYNSSYGLLRQTSPSSKVAIATFLCESYVGVEEDAADNYFIGARTLHYQLKRAATTRLNRVEIPFLVIVTNAVPLEKKLRLEKDGATVIVVDDVILPWWVKTGVTKWKDQFTK